MRRLQPVILSCLTLFEKVGSSLIKILFFTTYVCALKNLGYQKKPEKRQQNIGLFFF